MIGDPGPGWINFRKYRKVFYPSITASKLHFFDESSIIKTTGNRKYGNARVGKRTIEVQCYASNATFTINLIHLVVGVDYFNILQGPSNGLELLNFFDEALQVDRADGSAALERGDVVVMAIDFTIPSTLSHCYKICSIDEELSWFTNHCIHYTWIHVGTVSTKSNNFFNCTSCWQWMKRKWQLERQYFISRQKTWLGITGSVAIWYETDSIWAKNKQTRGKKENSSTSLILNIHEIDVKAYIYFFLLIITICMSHLCLF